jgi:tetratricopeptide (TPR) repeat protein
VGAKVDILPSISYADLGATGAYESRIRALLRWLKKFSRTGPSVSGVSADELHRLGEAANRSGRHREAASLLLRAIDADPRVAETHYELGRTMRALAEPARAVTCFRKAIELDPAHRDAHIDLASTMLGAGNPAAAEQSARRALALDAGSAPAHINLGAALEGQGKFGDAALSYRAALGIDADCLPALVNLSALCLRLGEIEESERSVEHALRISPDYVEAHMQRGNLLLEQRQPERAANSYRQALRLRPGHAAAECSIGFTFDMQGRYAEAMDCYDRAIAFDPAYLPSYLNRAAIWLLEEDYARGWQEYERRLTNPELAPLHQRFGQPTWDGAPLAGRRILVYAEQGLGDEILFASCLPEVIGQAGHCIIDCDPRLAGLFGRSFPQATVHGGGQTDPTGWLDGLGPVDWKVPAGSLPLHLRRKPEDFPRHSGFLRAAPEQVAGWRERLQALGPGPKIGLSWRGGVPQTGRGSRSIALNELLPVLRDGHASFVSLQYGSCDPELAAFRKQHGVHIHHWQEAIDDYDQTAALVCALDLVVSVCTAVVDLAGALGRPAWVLAPVRTDFRYGRAGAAMRWYPSVRVFRQHRYCDWQPVIADVAAELARLPR